MLLLLSLVLAANGLAWKGELRRGVVPIGEVLEKAEIGDFVVVEGEVRRTGKAHGGRILVFLADETGEVALVVPNHLRRSLAGGEATGGSGPGGARPQLGRRVRVAGLWDQAKLSGAQQGIRVQKVDRLEE
jgi:hypothetical protein